MSTEEYLLSRSVSLQVARDFLIENLSDVQTIFDTCKLFGVTNQMIVDILKNDFEGLNVTIVSSFFDLHGFDGSSLDITSTKTTEDNTFLFTMEWLNEKTLYNVFDKNFDGSFDSVTEMTFSDNFVADGVGFDGIDDTDLSAYSVNIDGVVTMTQSDGALSYIRAIEYVDTLNAVKIVWSDSYEFTSSATENEAKNEGDFEYLFLIEESADLFIA